MVGKTTLHTQLKLKNMKEEERKKYKYVINKNVLCGMRELTHQATHLLSESSRV